MLFKHKLERKKINKYATVFFIITTTLLLFCAEKNQAQQIPLYSQYFYNPFLYNPAQTGVNDKINVFFNYRKQWAGFDGAPETRTLTFDMPIAQQKAGIGFYLFSDVTNIFSKKGGFFSYAYHLHFSEKHRLSFGISGGVQTQKIDFEKVVVRNPNDLLLTNNNQRAIAGDATAGIHYFIKGLSIGLSVPQLVSSKFRHIDDNQKNGVQLERHYLASASYDFKFSSSRFTLSPLILFRTTDAFAEQIDAGFNFKYKDLAWIGAMYRYDADVVVAAGFKVHKSVSVGYSYDFGITDLADHNSGSHEIMLGFNFNRKGKKANEPSPIDSLIAEKLILQDSLMNALNSKMDSMAQSIDSLKNLLDEINTYKAENFDKEVNENNTLSSSQMDSLMNIFSTLQQQMTDSLKQYEEKFLQNRNNESSSERTKIIPREDIVFVDGEPLTDYYMVVGSFKIKENSFKLKRQLEERGYKLGIVYNKKRNWYYVYIGQAADKGLEELYQLRESKKDEFVDAWIYILR